MCGIGGAVGLSGSRVPRLRRCVDVMNELQAHRGPDGHGMWTHPDGIAGFAHRRLSIIDLESGGQPMRDAGGNWITYNGEIYNYESLRDTLGPSSFATHSDTEVILAAYRKWGLDCLEQLRGMFAFGLWDESRRRLLLARDRCGVKPLYYTVVDGVLYFSSEVKALLPFVPQIETDIRGLGDYLSFQFCLDGKTLFKDVHELPPAHLLIVENGRVEVRRYWQVYYTLDLMHTPRYFEERTNELVLDAVKNHLVSDVPVGSYVSGGLDSSLVASLASTLGDGRLNGFTGKFTISPEYDESVYARELAAWRGFDLFEVDITASDFVKNIRNVIYHMDYPVAGPGAFPQYIVSRLASQHRKVVLSGVGGDEIFGGYVRYLVAYFEQCIKGAIEGTRHNANYIVTYESIIPNLTALRNYTPMLADFWREGLFEPRDKRYYRLVNRNNFTDEIRRELLGDYDPFETFRSIFWGENVHAESYFDTMTHFDFKTLLPALLHVEDRVSMAHGLESRVPLLDHPLVEFVATIPPAVKFKDGTMKRIMRDVSRPHLPASIVDRTDKMGFPVPLSEWTRGELRDFLHDVFTSSKAATRSLIDNRKVAQGFATETKFGRKTWALLCLELWQQAFHDREHEFKQRLEEQPAVVSLP